jgi:hypothetical protein
MSLAVSFGLSAPVPPLNKDLTPGKTYPPPEFDLGPDPDPDPTSKPEAGLLACDGD